LPLPVQKTGPKRGNRTRKGREGKKGSSKKHSSIRGGKHGPIPRKNYKGKKKTALSDGEKAQSPHCRNAGRRSPMKEQREKERNDVCSAEKGGKKYVRDYARGDPSPTPRAQQSEKGPGVEKGKKSRMALPSKKWAAKTMREKQILGDEIAKKRGQPHQCDWQ